MKIKLLKRNSKKLFYLYNDLEEQLHAEMEIEYVFKVIELILLAK